MRVTAFGRMAAAALLSSLASASALSSARAADDPATVADLRCLVVITQVAGQLDAAKPGTAALSMFYFLGRIDGRDPAYDLKTGILQQSKDMKPDEITGELKRCGGQLVERESQLRQIGESIEQSQPSSPPQAAPQTSPGK